MFLIVVATTGALPTWYLANRVHAHTRLRINDCPTSVSSRPSS